MKIIFKNKNELLNTLYGDEEDYNYLSNEDIDCILDDHIKSLEKIYDFIEEHNLDELYDLGDCMNLIELFKKATIEEDTTENYINVRHCDECGKEMWDGFCIDSGMEYYCSEECLHKHYTDEEWDEMYDNGNSDSYWTDWYYEYEEYKRLKGIKESEE